MSEYLIKELGKNEPLPYHLLLLADETTAAIDAYIHECMIYVLENTNQVIGIYALLALGAKEVELKNIAVARQYQRKGLGKMLLNDAQRKAKEMNFEEMLIGTADVATRQLYLYQQAGFEFFTIKKNFFIDNYPEPIFENGRQLRDMLMLKKKLASI